MALYRPQHAHEDFKKKDTNLYLNPGVSKIEKVLKEFWNGKETDAKSYISLIPPYEIRPEYLKWTANVVAGKISNIF